MTWGPRPTGPDRTRFALWAPAVETLTLEIDGGDAMPMAREEAGWFAVTAMARPGTRYRFRLPDGTAVPDPAARRQHDGVHGWSVVPDAEDHGWRHGGWRGRPWRETVMQEVHAGVLGGFTGVAETLSGLAELGVTAIELMPIAGVSGTRNWGYDGVLPYAVAEALGTPEELKALIDRAHGLGIQVFLDVVYNHFGPDGNYIGAYAPSFFKSDVHTPWGGAIDFGQEAVARFFIDNALHWLRDYRFDGLRFDAVHAIADDAFLDRLAAEIRSALPDRHIHLVLENESNDAQRLERGFDAQWNDDFHNVLHVLLTDEHHAYYADFADAPAEKLARCLAEGFIYQGDPSPNHDGKPRGSASGHLPPTRFVSFLQNHDQVGNRALGDRLTTLVDSERLRAATGLLLLCPQIPLLFMGDEIGSRTPFLFFTDFHDELADAVREGRRREFAKFPAFADPGARERIPDPNARATFDASRPQPGPDAETWRTLYRDLLALRRDHIVPNLDTARAIGADAIGPKAVRARWRLGDATLTLALNLGDSAVDLASSAGAPLTTIGRGHDGERLAAASFVAWLEQAA